MAGNTADLGARIERDDELAESVVIVLDAAESGDGTVAWSDVSDDITAAQWGRLLGTGVLIETGDRFVIDDPVAAAEALESAADTPVAENTADAPAAESEDTGWSASDKMAGVGAVGLALGYRFPVIRDSVGPVVDTLFAPLQAILPFSLVVVVLAAGTGLVSIAIQSRMADYERMGERQERMSAISERLKDAKERGDEEAVERIQEEQLDAMTDQLGLFTQMLRPLAWTMLVTVPVLLWLYWLMLSPAQAVTPTAMVFPMLGRIVWTAKIIGPMQAWLLWYTICSVTSRQLIRKTFDIRTRPA